jgi:hypothetical protein
MPTETKATFDVNTRRAGYFLDLHESVHGGAQGAPLNPVRELPRAALVFAIGALDSYLSDVSAEVIVALLQRELPEGEVREVLKRVQGEVPTLSLELSLVPDPDERISRVREAVADHLHNRVSNHGKKAVSRTMERLRGNAQDLWSALGANGYQRAAYDLDDWTEKRHQIVHQGQSVRVTRDQARSCVQLVEAIGERIDAQAMQALEG